MVSIFGISYTWPKLTAIVVAIAVVIWILYMIYRKIVGGGIGGDKTMVLFYSETCPHCVAFMPQWGSFVAGNPPIKTQKFNLSDASNTSVAKNYGIEGVPEVRVYTGGVSPKGSYVEYQGERTADALLMYVKELVGQ